MLFTDFISQWFLYFDFWVHGVKMSHANGEKLDETNGFVVEISGAGLLRLWGKCGLRSPGAMSEVFTA